MGKYTIYHPGPPQTRANKINDEIETSYCTHLMIAHLEKMLLRKNHTVDVNFIGSGRARRRILQNIEENRLSHETQETLDADDLEDSCVSDVHIPSLNLRANRCPNSLWFILANDKTKKFVLFDLQDSPGVAYKILHHENLVFAFTGQYSFERIYHECSNNRQYIYKFIPFIYTAYYPKLTKNLRSEIQDFRNSIKKLDDRIFFYGNNRDSYTHSDRNGTPQKIREVISVLAEKYPDESCVGSWEAKLPLAEFFKKAATHTINLALPGHPWCSREHELWTLGLPVIMYEHTHHMAVPLLPNYHYVAVPGGPRLSIGMAKDPELAADRIIETHREWIKPENRWRLNMVAKNGQTRIDKHANYDTVWNTVLPLLKLGRW